MALVPNDSIEKPHRPVDLASNSLLLKKGKGKLKQDKNNWYYVFMLVNINFDY